MSKETSSIKIIERLRDHRFLQSAMPIFVILFLVLLVFAPVLFGKKMFPGGDILTYGYPILDYYLKALNDDHGLSKWNPYYLGGFPAFVSPTTFGSSPDFIIRLISLFSPSSDAITVYNIRAFSVGLFIAFTMFAFCKITGLGNIPSLVAGLSYFLAVFIPSKSMPNVDLSHSASALVLPGIFLALFAMKNKSRKLLYLFIGIFFVTFGLNYGHPQLVLYILIAGLVYALYLDYHSYKAGHEKPWSTVRYFMLMIFISVIIVLPAMLDTILFLPYSSRAHDILTPGINFPVSGLIVNILGLGFPPYLEIGLPFLGAVHPGEIFFIGPVAIWLAIIVLLFFSRDKKISFFIFGYLTMLAILTIQMIPNLIQHLPLFSYFQNVSKAMLIGIFFLSYIGGYGLESVKTAGVSLATNRKIKLFLKLGNFYVYSIVAAISGLSVFFLFFPVSQMAWQENLMNLLFKVLGKEMVLGRAYHLNVFNGQITALKKNFSLFNWRIILPILLFIGAFALIKYFLKRPISIKTFYKLATAITILNFVTVYLSIYYRHPSRAVYEKPPAVAIAIKNREADPNRYRILSFLTGESFYWYAFEKKPGIDEKNSAFHELMPGNQNIFYQIPRIDGYEPVTFYKTTHFLETISSEALPKISGVGLGEQITLKTAEFLKYLPLLSAYSVKYIWSGYPIENDGLNLIHSQSHNGLKLYLYENKKVLPKIFIPQKINFVDVWDDAYFIKKETAAVTIECDECDKIPPRKGSNYEISDIKYLPGTVSFGIKTDEPLWVIISEVSLPGWKAYIDSNPAPVYPADYLMQAIIVDAGFHSINLRYEGIVETELPKKLPLLKNFFPEK